MNKIFDNLIIFEMANNHMGDICHAKKIIEEYSIFIKKYSNFKFAIKFQMRDLDTLIHKNFKINSGNKAIERFQSTRLSYENFCELKVFADTKGFLTACTAFDEISLNKLIDINFDIIKVASCSNTDFPLLNEIVKYDKPIIISFGGSELNNIDLVVNFFQNRNKDFAILHCVGEYPTPFHNFCLNKIDFLKNRYNLPTGFSTHETRDNFTTVGLAIAKGACILEKHIGIETEKYPLNAYSTNFSETDNWLNAANNALIVCGNVETYSNLKEKVDILQFSRGVYLKNNIAKGQQIQIDDLYYALPLDTNSCQLSVSDITKYTSYKAINDISKDEPLLLKNIMVDNFRDKIYEITKKINTFVKNANLVIPKECVLEISSHYGINDFYNNGCAIFSLVNREYCKKYIILLPNQKHPPQFHKIKEETFIVIKGELTLNLDDKQLKLKSGDMITIPRNVVHEMYTETGCIIEELSTTHIPDDSYYLDNNINSNTNRKNIVKYWRLYD